MIQYRYLIHIITYNQSFELIIAHIFFNLNLTLFTSIPLFYFSTSFLYFIPLSHFSILFLYLIFLFYYFISFLYLIFLFYSSISFLCFILLYLSLIYRYTRLHNNMKPGIINHFYLLLSSYRLIVTLLYAFFFLVTAAIPANAIAITHRTAYNTIGELSPVATVPDAALSVVTA